MNTNRKRGFTLVEVLVALGIAGGALILLLSACRESLHRTRRAMENSRLELLAQSKLDELRVGAETGSQGIFPTLPGCEWHVSVKSAAVPAVKELERITLRVTRSEESGIREFSVLKYVKKADPQ